MRAFEVTTERGPGQGARVVVQGELDIATASDVVRALVAMEEPGPPLIALDLREVVHLDSSGLRIIIDAADRARREGRRLVVVAPPDGPVGRLLELTLVADHIEVVDDVAAVAP